MLQIDRWKMFERHLEKMLGDGNLECPAFGVNHTVHPFGGTGLKLFVFSHKTVSCGQRL
jgi:hypothetical protein